MGYSRPPKRDDGRIKVDPREKNGFNPKPKPVQPPLKRKPIRPKPPITIMPVPKRPARKSGRNR